MDRKFFIVSDKVPGCYCSKCGKRVMQDLYNYKKHGENCGFTTDDNYKPVKMDSYGYKLHKENDALVFSICKPELIPVRGFKDKFSGGGWSMVFQAVLGVDTKEIKITCQKTEISFDIWLSLIRAEKVVKIHREPDRDIIHSVFPVVVDIDSLQMFVHIYRTKGYKYRKVISDKAADKLLGSPEELMKDEMRVPGPRIYRRFSMLPRNIAGRHPRTYCYPVRVFLYHLKDENNTYILKVLQKTPFGVRGFLFSEDYVYTSELPVNMYEIFQTSVWYRDSDRRKLEIFADRYPKYQIRSFMEQSDDMNVLILLLAGNYHVLAEQAAKAGVVNVVTNMNWLPEFQLDPAVYKNLKDAFGLPVSFLKKLEWDMLDPRVLEELKALRKNHPAFVDFDFFTGDMIRFYLDSDLSGRHRNSRITGISRLNSRQILQIIRYLKKRLCMDYGTYRDYLDMCGQMGVYIDGLTPEDVGAAHGRILAMYQEKKDLLLQERFIQKVQMEDYQRLATDFEEADEDFFEKDEYVMILPKGSRDLILESQHMHNCVRSYAGAVSRGTTRIVFLRKKDEPEKSFGTIEVDCDNRLIQAKAFGNRHLDNKAQKFVRKWAKYKKLSIFTRDLDETA